MASCEQIVDSSDSTSSDSDESLVEVLLELGHGDDDCMILIPTRHSAAAVKLKLWQFSSIHDTDQ